MTLDWSQIEKYYDQGNTAGFALSLMESEKLLREVLNQKKFPGTSYDEKLEWAAKHLPSPQSLVHARQLTIQLLSLNLPRNINKQTTEQVLRVYFTGITELSDISSGEINKLRLSNYSRNLQRKTAKIILWLIAVLVTVIGLSLVLADTSSGQNVTQKILEISRAVVYKWLPIMLVVFTVIVIGIAISLRRKNKPESKAEPASKNPEV